MQNSFSISRKRTSFNFLNRWPTWQFKLWRRENNFIVTNVENFYRKKKIILRTNSMLPVWKHSSSESNIQTPRRRNQDRGKVQWGWCWDRYLGLLFWDIFADASKEELETLMFTAQKCSNPLVHTVSDTMIPSLMATESISLLNI